MKQKILLGAVASLVLYGCPAPFGPIDGGPHNPPETCTSSYFDPTRLTDNCAEIVQLGTGYRFSEGPAVDRAGNVYFTDQPNNRIHFWDWKTGEVSLFMDETGRANGMTFDRHGRLLTASDMHGEIWSINTKTGEHTVILDNFEGKLLNGPNDIWEAPNGALYITDALVYRNWWDADDPRRAGSQVGGGYVYRLSPDRKTLTRVAGMEQDQSDIAGNLRIQPNGIVGTEDGRTLYIGYIHPREIWAYDINRNGSLSNPRKFADSHSDGMTIDSKGNVYVTTREEGVTAFNPAGERIFNVPTGRFWTGNVAFAGPNRKSLFITAADGIFGLQMKVKGVQ